MVLTTSRLALRKLQWPRWWSFAIYHPFPTQIASSSCLGGGGLLTRSIADSLSLLLPLRIR